MNHHFPSLASVTVFASISMVACAVDGSAESGAEGIAQQPLPCEDCEPPPWEPPPDPPEPWFPASGVPAPSVPLLSRKTTPLDKVNEYYSAIGALAPNRSTFSAWTATNGFTSFGGDIVATYYNRGDLGFGRDMHCRTTSYGKACYVTNYGKVADGLADLNDGTALDDAIAHVRQGATVAMEWHQNKAPDDNPVRFFVYDTGSGGGLINAISLDSNPTERAIPGLCMNCHGGTFKDAASWGGVTRVEGAQFLPFDVESFAYHGSLPQWSQESQFRELNMLVRDTLPAGATSHELITGWYPNLGTFTGSFVPSGWQANPSVYANVYRPYCQMCHTAQASAPKSWSEFQAQANVIVDETCGSARQMPHTEITYAGFWQNPNNPPRILAQSLGLGHLCNDGGPNQAVAIAVGGNGLQMLLDSAGQVWAKNSIGNGGWTLETPPGHVAIAAGDNGLQMLIDSVGQVWAKNSIGNGGWTRETPPGHVAIAAGGNGLQMLIDGVGQVWAKDSIGEDGWTRETPPGHVAIAAGGNGLQMLIDGVGQVWAKDSIGEDGWTRETSP
jgi:hypothetical protein